MRNSLLESVARVASLVFGGVFAAVVLVSVALKRANPGVGLASVALTLLVVVFVTTVVINLPINADQLDWSVDHPPAD